jgi:hypothetical protein
MAGKRRRLGVAMPHLTPQAADALRADLVCGTRRHNSEKLPFCGIGPGNTYVLLSQLRAELPGRRSRGHNGVGTWHGASPRQVPICCAHTRQP